MKILQNIKHFFSRSLSKKSETDALLSEQLTQDRKRRETFDKTQYADIHSKSRIDEQRCNEQQLNEYLADERARRENFEKKQYEEIQSKNNEIERKSKKQKLNEYLDEERKRKKILEEKLLNEALEKKIPKEERPQTDSEEVIMQEDIETTEIVVCTCETTPDSEKIQCGYCGKMMCQSCWSRHQYSHGRSDPLSITYHSDGKTTGKF